MHWRLDHARKDGHFHKEPSRLLLLPGYENPHWSPEEEMAGSWALIAGVRSRLRLASDPLTRVLGLLMQWLPVMDTQNSNRTGLSMTRPCFVSEVRPRSFLLGRNYLGVILCRRLETGGRFS